MIIIYLYVIILETYLCSLKKCDSLSLYFIFQLTVTRLYGCKYHSLTNFTLESEKKYIYDFDVLPIFFTQSNIIYSVWTRYPRSYITKRTIRIWQSYNRFYSLQSFVISDFYNMKCVLVSRFFIAHDLKMFNQARKF